MDMKKLSDVAAYADEKMKKVKLFSTERVACDQYCLEPGHAQKVHAHEGEDKIYFVLEGSGTVTVGDNESPIGPDQIVIAPNGAPHGITNGDGGRMRVLVFMAPNSHFGGGHGHGHGHHHH